LFDKIYKRQDPRALREKSLDKMRKPENQNDENPSAKQSNDAATYETAMKKFLEHEISFSDGDSLDALASTPPIRMIVVHRKNGQGNLYIWDAGKFKRISDADFVGGRAGDTIINYELFKKAGFVYIPALERKGKSPEDNYNGSVFPLRRVDLSKLYL
jgi:hypothetical protein